MSSDVQKALADLEPGTMVSLQLRDGRELTGTIGDGALSADQVRLEDADQAQAEVDLGEVQDFLIAEDSDGIE